MSLRAKQWIIFILGFVFLASLLFVQWRENIHIQERAGIRLARHDPPADSKECYDCHKEQSPGIVEHWNGSRHAEKNVGCLDCHKAKEGEIDAFNHEGAIIATIVTPNDCGRCHPDETNQFLASHHAKAGNILASLDNFLAEWAEGNSTPYNPHSPTPGILEVGEKVNGLGTVNVGCKQCHGAKVALQTKDGGLITVDDLFDEKGTPVDKVRLAELRDNVARDDGSGEAPDTPDSGDGAGESS